MSNNSECVEELESYYFEEEDEEICGIKVPSITKDYVDDYPSLVDRFFTKYYYRRLNRENEDFLVLFHSNRVCLICLAPTHIAISKGIKNVTFDIGNLDRSQNQVKGKGKKGGMVLQDDSILALITCHDGSEYKVPSCVRGKLIEVNQNIISNTQLLEQEGDGYVAIILPKPENCDKIKESLISPAEYQQLLENV